MWNYLQQKVRYPGGKTEPGKASAERSSQADRNRICQTVHAHTDSAEKYSGSQDAGCEKCIGTLSEPGRTSHQRKDSYLIIPFIILITFYRRFISPLFPPCCRFYPTCSAYGIMALRTHGLCKGTILTVWRILRCNPFNRGGFDPVPPRGAWRPEKSDKENE